jgi:hypothetical protein
LAGSNWLDRNARFANRYVVEISAPRWTVPTVLAVSETRAAWAFSTSEASVLRGGTICISEHSKGHLYQACSRNRAVAPVGIGNRNSTLAK